MVSKFFAIQHDSEMPEINIALYRLGANWKALVTAVGGAKCDAVFVRAIIDTGLGVAEVDTELSRGSAKIWSEVTWRVEDPRVDSSQVAAGWMAVVSRRRRYWAYHASLQAAGAVRLSWRLMFIFQKLWRCGVCTGGRILAGACLIVAVAYISKRSGVDLSQLWR